MIVNEWSIINHKFNKYQVQTINYKKLIINKLIINYYIATKN